MATIPPAMSHQRPCFLPSSTPAAMLAAPDTRAQPANRMVKANIVMSGYKAAATAAATEISPWNASQPHRSPARAPRTASTIEKMPSTKE